MFVVADGNPDNAFVAVLARIGEGREPSTRLAVARALMATLEAETAAAFASRGLGLTVEVQEIERAEGGDVFEEASEREHHPLGTIILPDLTVHPGGDVEDDGNW